MRTTTVRRALLSVSDKSGLAALGRALADHDVSLLSTGGTAAALRDAGLEVTDVSAVTGFPEIMGGRVKTLHPKVHGGLLGRRGTDDDVMAAHNIAPIDLLVVNLYPFEQTVAREDCRLDDAIENIDIGGPAMLRAAAKNHRDVGVVVDPADYARVIDAIGAGGLDDALRLDLATRAFEHTARYDGAIANYLGRRAELADSGEQPFPRTLSLQFNRALSMRYGENPHQQAALYTEHTAAEANAATATQHQGKSLSFNNVADTDAALECVRAFDECACVIVKHANPCGVAVAGTNLAAYQRAFDTDPTSAFGGIIAFNRPLDGATAAAIIERQFVEVVIAPGLDAAALDAFGAKSAVRVLECAPLTAARSAAWHFQRVNGGLLVQDRDLGVVPADALRVVTEKAPDTAQAADLRFAWTVAKFVKSNAIVYARDGATIGVGAGQMSRVYSARIAGIKAADEGLTVPGSVLASDAFFPFRDGIDAAADAGISAVIQPGGSVRDDEVISAANEHGIAMLFTGMRHFRH